MNNCPAENKRKSVEGDKGRMRIIMTKHLLLACVSVATIIVSAPVATAQSTTSVAPQEPDASPGDIIVTANKREQSVNDVGLTITAASGEELNQRGIDGPEDLAKLVPGFTFTQSLYSTPVYTLRGIGLYDATFGAAPSVAVYTDQIPRNVPTMSDALELDVERIEVLKGPQGTLFGQSSTGGAVNYILGKPTTGRQRLLRAFRSLRAGRLREWAPGRGCAGPPRGERCHRRCLAA